MRYATLSLETEREAAHPAGSNLSGKALAARSMKQVPKITTHKNVEGSLITSIACSKTVSIGGPRSWAFQKTAYCR